MCYACKNAILHAKPYIKCAMPYSFSTCKHFLGHEHNQIMYKHIKSSGFPSIELIMHCISLIYNKKTTYQFRYSSLLKYTSVS